MLSAANFRRDSRVNDLKDGVNEVFTALKVRGDCVIEWMSYLQETDMISSLLCAKAIARREMEVSRDEAKFIRLTVVEILSEFAFSVYMRGDASEGEEMIKWGWARMLEKREEDFEATPPLPKEIYHGMRAVYAHYGTYHQEGTMSNCAEVKRMVEYWMNFSKVGLGEGGSGANGEGQGSDQKMAAQGKGKTKGKIRK